MIIGFTGRIASGKGAALKFLEKNDFKYYSHSDEVREEAKKRGIEITRENLQDLGNEIREEEGAGGWTKRLMESVRKDMEKNVIIDGIRNPGEIEVLRKNPDFVLISISAPQEERFKRVVSRDRESDPKTWEEFLRIDNRDFGEGEDSKGQQVGKCIKLADYSIENNSTIDELNSKVKELLKEIIDKNN